MRIGEVGALTGVSVRMLRHYHRMGILPEPERTSGGYREYGVADVVRALRIRRLSEAGWTLRDIDVGPSHATGEELRSEIAELRAAIDAEIENLRDRRSVLDGLERSLDDVVEPFGPPVALVRAMEVVAEAARGRPAAAMLAEEFAMLSLLAAGPGCPPQIVRLYTSLADDPVRCRDYLDVLDEFASLEGADPVACHAAVDTLAGKIVADPEFATVMTALPEGEKTAVVDLSLDQLVPDPAQRAVIQAVLIRLGRKM